MSGTDRAISAARAALALDARLAARAWPVRRLDRPGATYLLVVFGAAAASVAVAALDSASLEVMVSARLPGTGPHVTIGGQEAVQLAGAKGDALAELVWTPCQATRSMLYPLWQVGSPEQPVFVDFSGILWSDLAAGRPGG